MSVKEYFFFIKTTIKLHRNEEVEGSLAEQVNLKTSKKPNNYFISKVTSIIVAKITCLNLDLFTITIFFKLKIKTVYVKRF